MALCPCGEVCIHERFQIMRDLALEARFGKRKLTPLQRAEIVEALNEEYLKRVAEAGR